MTLLSVNRLFRVVRNVNNIFGGNSAPKTSLGAYIKHGLALTKLRERRWGVTHRDDAEAPVGLVKHKQSESGVTKSSGVR